jgi:hypothetical protein
MAGGSLADVQRNHGHSSPVITSETYDHRAEDHRVREADQLLSLGLGRAVEPQTGTGTVVLTEATVQLADRSVAVAER